MAERYIDVADKTTLDRVKSDTEGILEALDGGVSGSGQAVILLTTNVRSYYGRTVTLRHSSNIVSYTGVVGDDGRLQATVSYTGTYHVTCGGGVSQRVVVSQLGEVVERELVAHYGFKVDSALTDPDAIVAPLQECANYNYRDVKMDFSTGVIDGGDWFDVDEDGVISNAPFFFPRSCMLRYDGTVSYYLDENDEARKEDGTASDVANSAYGGNAMMEWGQDGQIIWMKVVPDADGYGAEYHISNVKLDADYTCYPFVNKNNEVVPHFYTPKYFGSSDGTRMRSLSGTAGYVNGTADSEISLARANGADIWDTETWAQRQLISVLLVLMCGTTDMQGAYGYGRCKSSNTAAINSGTMDGKGMFFGSDDQVSGVKVFGMENWWGNLWRRVRGLTMNSGQMREKMTRGTYDGTTATDYNLDGAGYSDAGVAVSANTSGYVSRMRHTKKGWHPAAASGSDSTHYCDYTWLYYSTSAVYYALVGGDWHYGLYCGAFYVNLANAASYSGADIGAALSCTPLT